MHRYTRSRRATTWVVALLVSGVVGITSGVLAQAPVTTAAVPLFPGALIRLHVAASDLQTVGSGTSVTYQYPPAGRFQVWTDPLVPRGGDPTRSGDENRYIASIVDANNHNSFSSKVTVAVDVDELDPTVGYYYDVDELAAAQGDDSDPANLINYWPVPLRAGSRDISGEFRLPVAFDDDDNPTEYIRVRQITTVIGDTVQLEWIVYNTSTAQHTVGLRVCVDAQFGGGSQQDGQPIYLPDGRTIDAETMIPDPQGGIQILPAQWLAYDDASNPNVVLRGLVSGFEVTNPGTAGASAGLPSNIAWGQMRNIGQPNQFFFQPNPQASLVNEDWGYAVTWLPVELGPGQSRRFVTYYGMGSSAADYDPPYAMMAYAPFLLKSAEGDDPATPDTVETYYYTDQEDRSPFPLSVFMDNFGTSSLLDASVRIRLPLGLELVSGESLTKSAGTLQRNEIDSVTWNVRATAVRPGRASVKFTGPRGKVLEREFSIPALPVLNPLPGSTNGLEMVSIPYEFANTDAEWVFQSLGSLVPGGPATLVRYHPQEGYKFFPSSFVSNVAPGVGYWLLNRNREVVNLPSDATPVEETVNVDLQAGWNQIGNPFLVSMRFDQVRVLPASGGEWSLEEAVSRNVLQPTLFAYDPASNQYTWELELSDTRLDPYVGYWVLIREDCTLQFPPPSMASPAQAAPEPAITKQAANPGDWRLGLVVSTPGLASTAQSLAVRAGAGTGLDRHDVVKPPASLRQDQTYLQSALYPGQNALGMPYLVDTRGPASGKQTWNLIVKTNVVNQPVTVSWPALQGLPRDLIATLVDPVTGQRQYMRTTSSYTFRTGTEPTERLLKIVVQPRPQGALTVSGVTAAAVGRGSVGITYTLSADAAVDIRVRNMAGIIVSTPARGTLATAGNNTVLWSGQSDRGTPVPSGRYLCEITARSVMTGEAISVIAPLEVRR